MALSRSARITFLLFIDVLFFFVELIVGYAVGSLALVADSFHMLNDILSLGVALYAIKLTGQRHEDVDPKYSYGWHRAEILAALINGVFLLALCFSIFMEAIERFFSTPEISNPKLVVIVGSLGLASNFLGLFLFHEHDHSHDHESHSKKVKKTKDSDTGKPVNERAYPDSVISSGTATPTQEEQRGRSRERADSLYGHPAATRARVVQEAQELQRARSPSTSRSGASHFFEAEDVNPGAAAEASESTPLLGSQSGGEAERSTTYDAGTHEHRPADGQETRHSGGHSHSGSMNMQALVLHVLGDALGNVGVIATGLIIWLSNLSWKYYFDPIISLVITCIIFSSALPLVKSASFILLQGVPTGISLQEVDEAIRDVEGVEDVHELHIWQLSESKVVASVHVLASRKHDFMQVAIEIRKALHERGIHSSTIQPEYHPASHPQTPVTSSLVCPTGSCLINCPPNQKDCNPIEHACCPPPAPTV